MKVLITNLTMAERSGTVIVTRDICLTLKNLGHFPLVYTSRIGPVADELRAQGVPVVSDITKIEEVPDVIHGHHTLETATAALYFPHTPAIFVCHDFTAWHDVAPRLANIVHYAAISHTFRRRLTAQDGIHPDATSVVLNGVDTDRFLLGPALPEIPRRALIFVKSEQHLRVVQAACDLAEIHLDAVGSSVGVVIDRPEDIIVGYDLIFTSALNAMECIVAGRAVIVCDGRGLAGFATLARYDAWRAENFGVPIFDKRLTVDAVRAEIDNFDRVEAVQVSQRLRHDANLQAWTASYLEIYRSAISRFQRPDANAVGRSGAGFLQQWSPLRLPAAWLAERDALREQIDRLTACLDCT